MLIAVLDDPARVGALRSALRGLGLDAGRIETLCGARPAPQRGRARRLLGALGPEAELARSHALALQAGHALVIVRGVRRAEAAAACDALLTHGAHSVLHYGGWTVALLAA
jgi:hypothetical protein